MLELFGLYQIFIKLCNSKYFYKMKSDTKSVEDIKAIRKMMEESSRFLSLSGLSGVFAGITAIAGALVAYFFILDKGSIRYEDYLRVLSANEALLLRWQADCRCFYSACGFCAFCFLFFN